MRLQGELTYHASKHHTTHYGLAARTCSAAWSNFARDSPEGDREGSSCQAREHPTQAPAGRCERGTSPAPGAHPHSGRLSSLYSENAPPGIWTPSPGVIASTSHHNRLDRWEERRVGKECRS